ncbi:DNA (cytosine-5-)-methyltransferase [Moraxella macacae 0408225]|uniref:Cytosine-specific methyltransferase n=1 Tax=Moraxella macacae 0408225 TaxID=1230338 RepID=L2F7Q7_9GAMM|nr:HpaII family restriction endonuclease [Moraxella macacae]ELA08503.1 DNA (cytosine-5-)-methyltransferase [Moraxella macacae 0408225]
MAKLLTFVDLFAGIGGFHLALSDLGAKCVFASEKDSHARQTYRKNFDTTQFELNEDIRKIAPEHIPDHDILCAGFPCQPFSQAGLKKGFQDGADSERGNLFFCIVDILEAKKPKAFILENVRHLVNHDDGKTYATILTLLDKAGYVVQHQVLKASDYNVPQHRPRVFLVGFKKDISSQISFNFPPKMPLTYTMSDIFNAPCEKQIGFTLRVGGKGSPIDDRRNWEFYRVAGEVRRIGLSEAKRMMTYPDSFEFPVSKTQAMKQLGNSVCVEVVRQIAKVMIEQLQSIDEHKPSEIIQKTPIKCNKGELSEIYALLKLIHQRILPYGDSYAKATQDQVLVTKIHTATKDIDLTQSEIEIFANHHLARKIPLQDVVNQTELNEIFTTIRESRATFSSDVMHIQALSNASQATNFIFEIKGLDATKIDEINQIQTSAKIKDRIEKIEQHGGVFEFVACENHLYESTLRKVDSLMPEILAQALLGFFKKQFGKYLYQFSQIQPPKKAEQIECRLRDFVKCTVLGIFPTQVWSGELSANSVLLINHQGELLFYHTKQDKTLKDFFYQNTFFDTPSSTRHRFGSIYQEKNKVYFKLNLQLRLAEPKNPNQENQTENIISKT